MTVDWGDGSTTEQSSDLAASFSHTYAEAGTYEVEISCADGETWSPGYSTTNGSTTTYRGLLGANGKSNSYPTLTEIKFGDGVLLDTKYALCNCTGLTTVEIANGIPSISDYCFYHCTMLATIKIPPSVISFGTNAFDSCNNISAVYINDIAAWCQATINETSSDLSGNDSNRIYSPHALYLNNQLVTDLIIPEGVTAISRSAFNNCTSITSVITPTTLTKISIHAFYKCTSLVSATLNGDCGDYTEATVQLLELAGGMFDGCTNLRTVTFAPTWSFIRIRMFGDCTALSSITIPPLVTNISQEAFAGCTNLQNVVIPSAISEIGPVAFAECVNAFSGNLEL